MLGKIGRVTKFSVRLRSYSASNRSGMKRVQSSSSSDLFSPPKRRAVTTKTVDKPTWLEYDQADRYHVAVYGAKFVFFSKISTYVDGV